jgi:NTE family protein
MKVLQREGIVAQAVAGNSIGTIMGVGYAMSNGNALELEHIILEHFQRLNFRRCLRFTGQGLHIDTDALERFFTANIPPKRLEDFPIPIRVVATDLRSGKPVSLDRGPVGRLLVASILLPYISPPMPFGDYLLTDGGLLTNVPFLEVEQMNVDLIIGVNNRHRAHAVPPLFPLSSLLLPPIVLGKSHPFRRTFDSIHAINMRQIERLQLSMLRTPYFLIEPSLDDVKGSDYPRAAEIIRRGEEAAEHALPLLRHYMEEVQRWKEKVHRYHLSMPGRIAVHASSSLSFSTIAQ